MPALKGARIRASCSSVNRSPKMSMNRFQKRKGGALRMSKPKVHWVHCHWSKRANSWAMKASAMRSTSASGNCSRRRADDDRPALVLADGKPVTMSPFYIDIAVRFLKALDVRMVFNTAQRLIGRPYSHRQIATRCFSGRVCPLGCCAMRTIQRLRIGLVLDSHCPSVPNRRGDCRGGATSPRSMVPSVLMKAWSKALGSPGGWSWRSTNHHPSGSRMLPVHQEGGHQFIDVLEFVGHGNCRNHPQV